MKRLYVIQVIAFYKRRFRARLFFEQFRTKQQAITYGQGLAKTCYKRALKTSVSAYCIQGLIDGGNEGGDDYAGHFTRPPCDRRKKRKVQPRLQNSVIKQINDLDFGPDGMKPE